MPRFPVVGIGLALISILCFGVPRTRADEAAIRADIEAFFQTDDSVRRQQLASQIQADPAYDRAKVSQWLHRANLFKPMQAGRQSLAVPLGNDAVRDVVLRLPRDYDCHRAWPLIYALHGSGGHGADIIGYVERILGPRVEDYIVAAPEAYGECIIHQKEWPPAGEHPAALLKIKQTVHINSDRVFVMGYSLGGHTTWTVAVLYADQFAGAIPLAGAFTIILPDYLWESFLPNLAALPVLCVWGADDTEFNDGRGNPDGGLAGLNRKLREKAGGLALPLTAIEDPNKGHGGVVPPADELAKLLASTRVQYPRSVRHTFRHISQAQAYWIEGHKWTGDQWTDKQRTIHLREGENQFKDEDVDQAAAREFRGLLGELRGEIDGQQLRVHRRKLSELTVWIGDGMIDWDKPVVLKAGGREDFEGQLQPDLYIGLSQAARTWDFDRLRWAGLRIKSGSKTRPVTRSDDITASVPLVKPQK